MNFFKSFLPAARISPATNQGSSRLSSVLLLFLIIGVFFVLYFYRAPVKAFAKESVELYGYPALFAFCWFADAVIQPIPPDVVVFGTAFGGANIWKTSVLAGLASTIGGATGYFIGKSFGPWRFRRFFGSKLLRGGRDLFRDHGSLAIFVAGRATGLPERSGRFQARPCLPSSY